MSSVARVALLCLVAASLFVATRGGPTAAQPPVPLPGGAQYRLDRASAKAAHAPLLGAAQRARTFTFAPGTRPDSRRFFLAAVASARPEAQRLIGLVDGLVTVRFADPGNDHVGEARFDGRAYELVIDLDRVLSGFGARDGTAVVLHELGHVVDMAIVPDGLVAELDAGIPTGIACTGGRYRTGACAPVEERFADTFAKWAMDDLGVSFAEGYRILPPVPLAAWGAPLTKLGEGA
jgi:hypothetical protein